MRLEIQRMSLLVVLIGLAGCETLYNAENDKAAHDASKAFTEAGLGSAFEAERAALIKNQAERQLLVKRSQFALRDASIALFIDAAKPETTWGELAKMTQKRVETIAGAANVSVSESCRILMPGAKADLLDSSRNTRTGANQLAIARRNLDFATVNANQRRSQINIALAKLDETSAPACTKKPWTLPTHLQSDFQLTELTKSYDKMCVNVDIAAQCIADLSVGKSGLLAQAHNVLADIAEAKADIAEEVSKQRKIYVGLLAEAEKDGGRQGAAEVYAGKLKAALDNIEKVEAKVSSVKSNPVLSRLAETGKITALEEKRKILEAYIDALSGKSSPTATLGQHRVLLVSNLVNRATSKPTPPTAGILMEAEFNRQQIAATQARIERASEAERIIKSQRDYLLDELGFLMDTEAHLAEAARPCTNKPLYAALSIGAADQCSIHAAKALLFFSAAWTAGRIPVEQSDYLQIDQMELAALDESEAALTQTDSVIKAAITQIGLLYAGGIKPEDLAAFAQALSLPVIAVRVR